tara:strand:+ start:347 stop:1312 length:966 start_codon:yes stop_codon:yes gene_type:complete
MKLQKCPICNDEKVEELIDWNSFKIHRCLKCKLLFATPLPSEEQLMQFYQGFLFKQPDIAAIQKEIQARKKEIKGLFGLDSIDGQSFLDYGGGTGVVFKAITELGLVPYYYDIDEKAIEFTKSNFGLRSDQMVLNIKTCEKRFNYIFSDNVIEHILDPYDFIDALYQKLEKGGKLILKTPNASNTETYFNFLIVFQSYFIRAIPSNGILKSTRVLFKRSWHCDPPRHIYSFTKESFDCLMEKMGIPKSNYEIDYYSTPWFSNTITKQFFSKDKHNNVLKSIILRIITVPVVILEVVLQTLKWLFINLNLVSKSGLVLKIDK